MKIWNLKIKAASSNHFIESNVTTANEPGKGKFTYPGIVSYLLFSYSESEPTLFSANLVLLLHLRVEDLHHFWERVIFSCAYVNWIREI